jgi:hypothetical protein
MHDQHVGLKGVEANRVEILVGVERHVLVEALVVGEHARRRHEERVAVRRGRGDGRAADIAAGAAAVLDHARRLELGRQPFAQQSH